MRMMMRMTRMILRMMMMRMMRMMRMMMRMRVMRMMMTMMMMRMRMMIVKALEDTNPGVQMQARQAKPLYGRRYIGRVFKLL